MGVTVGLRSSDPRSEAGSNERKSSSGICKGTGAGVQRLRLGRWVGVRVSFSMKTVARYENRGLTARSRLQPQARFSCPSMGRVGVRIFLHSLLASPPFPPCARHRGTYDTVLHSGAHSITGERPVSDKSSYLDTEHSPPLGSWGPFLVFTRVSCLPPGSPPFPMLEGGLR